jgi:hypothetical protein
MIGVSVSAAADNIKQQSALVIGRDDAFPRVCLENPSLVGLLDLGPAWRSLPCSYPWCNQWLVLHCPTVVFSSTEEAWD